jgi:class 3 adenylate cyclase/tetratricopeptide (TPR) repeat protein
MLGRERSRNAQGPVQNATVKRAVVTVLKADISGSTPLGEKLDPEELRGVLGSYFGALAREIQRHGGLVDKYIGDAVMAVFGLPDPQPDDAARATRAALAMQDAIAVENESLAARYGVRLSLRIGVNTGELVGPDDAELTLMGETVALAERMEASAPLNSVLVSESTRRAATRRFRFVAGPAVTPKGTTDSIPSFRALAARKHSAERRATARTGSASASLQVAGQRQHILQEERKIVTVLFADVAVADGHLAPDAVRPVLGAYFGAVAREIQRFGGTIDKFIGDAVMAVFGAPISHDDDGSRAIAAGLAIQASIVRHNVELKRDYGVQLAARVGVNTGEVVAGLLPGEVLAYTVTGDAVNTAQRIESVAPAGQVLVSESTYALARNAFVFEAVAPLKLKGKAEPVPAFRVIRRERRASVRGGTALVGRGDALDALHGFLRAAAAGHAQAVHIHGEAGVGKTRVVGEFLTRSPAASRVRARCSSYESETPYALVADLLRRMFRLQDTDDAETARAAVGTGLAVLELQAHESAATVLLEVLGYGSGSTLDPEAKRRLLISVLHQLFAQRTTTGVLVVVLEDTHWIDPASAEALTGLVISIAAVRCVILSTSRSAAVPWPAERVPLEPLESASAEAMIDQVAAVPLDPKVRQLVLERTGGNPFFIEEVVRSLADGRSATVPMTVQELLEARVDALEPSPRFVAQRAAVIGRVFATRVLERVTPGEPLDPSLGTLEAERFVEPREPVPDRLYAFRHALVQEVVYKTQLVSQRRRAHVAVGDAVSALYEGRLDEFVDALAYHYGRGDDDAKARSALLRAGRRAQRLYANEEAVGYFRGAIERSANDLEIRALAHEGLGDVQRVTGVYREAQTSYEAALATRADGSIERARIRRKMGVIEQLQGRTDVAADVFARVAAELPDEASAERARALQNLGDVYWRQGRYDDALGRLREAVAAAERAGDDDARAEVLKQLGSVHLARGDLDEALRAYERSHDIYKTIGDVLGEANVHNNIGLVRRRQSRYADALAAHERALAIRQRIGDPLGIGNSRLNVALIDLLQGDLDRAEAEYREALEVFASIGYLTGIASARGGLGVVKVERGAAAEGRNDLLAALQEFEQVGNRSDLVTVFRDLAQAYVGDDPAAALAWATRAVETAEALGAAEKRGLALQILGVARAAAGDAAGAATVLEQSRAILETGSERLELARTLAALSRAYALLPASDPRRSEAAGLADAARATFEELGARLELRRLGSGLAAPVK